MQISDILRNKGPHGTEVVTISPDAAVSVLLAALAKHNVGALVVLGGGTSAGSTSTGGTSTGSTSTGDTVAGIVSERDIVRALNHRGAAVLASTVAEIMTTPVISCTSGDLLDQVAETMTQRRVRHMPVIDDGRLAGIVTIGDVVLNRTRQLEQEREQLEHYITS